MNHPNDLYDGVESLRYWRNRTERLPWYRFQSRREARLMARRWEQRVRGAVFTQRGVALSTRVSAGLLLGQLGLQRFRFRAVVVAATVAAAILAVPFMLTVFLLTEIF